MEECGLDEATGIGNRCGRDGVYWNCLGHAGLDWNSAVKKGHDLFPPTSRPGGLRFDFIDSNIAPDTEPNMGANIGELCCKIFNHV